MSRTNDKIIQSRQNTGGGYTSPRHRDANSANQCLCCKPATAPKTVAQLGGPPPVEKPTVAPKVGRNEPCLCGSGKKHKKCCGSAAT